VLLVSWCRKSHSTSAEAVLHALAGSSAAAALAAAWQAMIVLSGHTIFKFSFWFPPSAAVLPTLRHDDVAGMTHLSRVPQRPPHTGSCPVRLTAATGARYAPVTLCARALARQPLLVRGLEGSRKQLVPGAARRCDAVASRGVRPQRAHLFALAHCSSASTLMVNGDQCSFCGASGGMPRHDSITRICHIANAPCATVPPLQAYC
jgi:hypothetical protein